MKALLLVVVGIAACGHVTHPRPAWTVEAEESSSDLICHEEHDTGSLFTHTVCRPRDEERADQDDAQRWMKHKTADPSSSQRGGIGGTYGAR
jgi:hypothetical protein